MDDYFLFIFLHFEDIPWCICITIIVRKLFSYQKKKKDIIRNKQMWYRLNNKMMQSVFFSLYNAVLLLMPLVFV